MEAATTHVRVSLHMHAAIRRACESTVLVLVCASALLLACRRAAGAFVDPLPGAAMLGVGAASAWAAIYLWRGLSRGTQLTVRSRAMIALVPILLAVLVAVILSIPGSGPWGLAALWTCVASVPVAILLGETGYLARRPAERRRQAPADLRGGDSADERRPLDAAVSQRLVRRIEADGRAVVEGLVRASFERGQRIATAHVAFCPPLAGEAQCSTEQVDGQLAEIRVAQLLPYGVRFEVKLERIAAADETVLFEFYACEAGDAGSGEPS